MYLTRQLSVVEILVGVMLFLLLEPEVGTDEVKAKRYLRGLWADMPKLLCLEVNALIFKIF